MSEYKHPKSWSEVNLDKYIKLHNLYKEEEDEIELTFKRLSILLEIPYSQVEEIPLVTYNQMKEDLAFLQKEPNQTKYLETFEIDGITFKMINLNGIKLGQWVDLEYYQKDFINNIHRILAILYKPESTFDDVSEFLLNKMDVETGLSAFFFFYAIGLSFTPSDLEGYSMLEKAMMEMEKAKNQLENELSHQ